MKFILYFFIFHIIFSTENKKLNFKNLKFNKIISDFRSLTKKDEPAFFNYLDQLIFEKIEKNYTDIYLNLNNFDIEKKIKIFEKNFNLILKRELILLTLYDHHIPKEKLKRKIDIHSFINSNSFILNIENYKNYLEFENSLINLNYGEHLLKAPWMDRLFYQALESFKNSKNLNNSQKMNLNNYLNENYYFDLIKKFYNQDQNQKNSLNNSFNFSYYIKINYIENKVEILRLLNFRIENENELSFEIERTHIISSLKIRNWKKIIRTPFLKSIKFDLKFNSILYKSLNYSSKFACISAISLAIYKILN